jgi:hypothetical protein
MNFSKQVAAVALGIILTYIGFSAIITVIGAAL